MRRQLDRVENTIGKDKASSQVWNQQPYHKEFRVLLTFFPLFSMYSFLHFSRGLLRCFFSEFDNEIFFIFYFNLILYFFIIKIWIGMSRQTFLILKKIPLATLAFSIQHLTAKTILTQVWKVEDQFDTVERLGTNLTQKPKVEN